MPRHKCSKCNRSRDAKFLTYINSAITGKKQWQCLNCFDARLLGKHCKRECLLISEKTGQKALEKPINIDQKNGVTIKNNQIYISPSPWEE
jgi:hypothetical protein